jgi:predicted nucleic acid-binding protein
MLRAFLDANVLFSAAYRETSGLTTLWKLRGMELITSAYAAEEARRNLASADKRTRLEDLLARTRIVAEADAQLPSGVRLPDKDHPILKAAIAAEVTHLVTGDVKDFGRYFGKRIAGVLVVTPADFIRAEETGRCLGNALESVFSYGVTEPWRGRCGWDVVCSSWGSPTRMKEAQKAGSG